MTKRIQQQPTATSIAGKFVVLEQALGGDTERASVESVAGLYVPAVGELLQRVRSKISVNDETNGTGYSNTSISQTITPLSDSSRHEITVVFVSKVLNSSINTVVRTGSFQLYRETGTPGEISYIDVGLDLTDPSIENNEVYDTCTLVGDQDNTSLATQTYTVRFKSGQAGVRVQANNATYGNTYITVEEYSV